MIVLVDISKSRSAAHSKQDLYLFGSFLFVLKMTKIYRSFVDEKIFHIKMANLYIQLKLMRSNL